jgi:peptide/nickel transport system substrate-binding protein
VIAAPAAPSQLVLDAGGGAYIYPATEISAAVTGLLISNPYVKSTQDPAALTQVDDKYVGELASSYDVDPSGRIYTFHLKSGVVSPAGNPFTADDVVWSFDEKMNTPTAPFKYGAAGIITSASQVKKVGPMAVSFTIPNRGYGATLLSLLANIEGQIYDSELLKSHATPKDPFAIAWAQAHPTSNISYGAYSIASVSPTQTVLVANPRAVNGPPAIKKVIYEGAADSATRSAALQRGDIDIAENLNPTDQASLQKSGSAQVFNVNTDVFGYFFPVSSRAPFNNTAVRQAMAYAIPYDQILKNVYLGRATKPTGFLNASAPGYTSAGVPTYTYDPTKAKQLLASAGHPGGVSFTITVDSGVPDTAAAAIQIQSAAAAAGFHIKIQTVASNAFVAGQDTGSFQAELVRDDAITQTPPYELALYTTPGATSYWTKWQDPQFTSLLNTANAVSNPFSNEGGAAYARAEGYLLDQAAIIPYAQVKPSFGVAKGVIGWAWRSDNFVDLSQLSFSK